MHRHQKLVQKSSKSSKSTNSLQATSGTSKPRCAHQDAPPVRSERLHVHAALIPTSASIIASLVSVCVLAALGEHELAALALAIAGRLEESLTQLLKSSA